MFKSVLVLVGFFLSLGASADPYYGVFVVSQDINIEEGASSFANLENYNDDHDLSQYCYVLIAPSLRARTIKAESRFAIVSDLSETPIKPMEQWARADFEKAIEGLPGYMLELPADVQTLAQFYVFLIENGIVIKDEVKTHKAWSFEIESEATHRRYTAECRLIRDAEPDLQTILNMFDSQTALKWVEKI